MTTEKIILDGHKLMWHQDRMRKWLSGERIAPITVDMALTPKCTYNCIYCYGQLQRQQDAPLKREQVLQFLDDASEIGVKAVSLVSDGESTCSPHLNETILRGHQNGLDMALGTNGYLLQDERLEEILPALTYLRFNISAGESERYAGIHGCGSRCFEKVCNTIQLAVKIKRVHNLQTTIGLQMVLMPDFQDQILPLAQLGKRLGVDYLVIKHCSDDESGSLGVDYSRYADLVNILKSAEEYSTENYLVKVKWSKILSGGQRMYEQCYGPPFILQISGSGLVAPCGMLFNDKYRRFHIGNLREHSFRAIWESEQYWQVMRDLSGDNFNAKTDCGTLCLQHKVNEYLWEIKQGKRTLTQSAGIEPMHVNFI